MPTDPPDISPTDGGSPIGRRIVLGLIAMGAAGIVGGSSVQDRLAKVIAPIQHADPTGLISLLPLGATFRYYSVTGSVRSRNAQNYRLDIRGLVGKPMSYTLADLEKMPQTTLVRDFQCVTGWRVPEVHWSGVRLSDLLDAAQPAADAKALSFGSFDGTYTESLTIEQARRTDVLVSSLCATRTSSMSRAPTPILRMAERASRSSTSRVPKSRGSIRCLMRGVNSTTRVPGDQTG